MELSWKRSQEDQAIKHSRPRTQVQADSPEQWGPPSTLLVIQHNIWLPDLLCRDTHELRSIVVGGVPLQLVVIPDLGGEGKEGEGGSGRTSMVLLLLTPLTLVTSPPRLHVGATSAVQTTLAHSSCGC